MLTLKFCARFACHTSRTSVTKKVPRLPCSLDRFHTPEILLYISSPESSFSCLSDMMLLRSFRSRYGRVASYWCRVVWRMLNSSGLSRTREVNMNSKRLPLNLVRQWRACVLPFRRLLAFLILELIMQLSPTERLVRFCLAETHNSRRLVIRRFPLSPLFPLVSSTSSTSWMMTSPGRIFRCETGLSNLISLSCQRLPSSCSTPNILCRKVDPSEAEDPIAPAG
mmetsp:Transcript_12043/g.28563  ORF Transcript_12043/g.28563 Transcript_12043/m.28563 type:complete len:224 (-) Transcript_12043:261-932(-)